MAGRRNRIRLIIPLVGMAVGIMIIVMPMCLDAINKTKNSSVISSMTSRYDNYLENGEEIERQFSQAELYNKVLAGEYVDGSEESSIAMSDKVEDFEKRFTDAGALPYDEQLTFDGGGIMSWIEIPKAGIKMIIYHGTDDEVLAIGAGHLQGTSLPIGGPSTHAVITAHSGMKTMKAFDNLRKLEEGDIFYITTLGRKLKYVVEQVETILPYETDSLEIVKGEDRVTLVTCTPYGINDHRLLVHGVRADG